MIRRVSVLSAVALLVGGVVFLASAREASAASGPVWEVKVTPNADYFLSGSEEYAGVYKVEAKNVGDESSTGELKLENVLPPSLNAEGVKYFFLDHGRGESRRIRKLP